MTPRAVDSDDMATMVAALCERAANVRGDVREVVAAEVDRVAPLATSAAREALIARAVARLDGLDVLELHLRDPDVDEVMVNAGREVWVERQGAMRFAGSLLARRHRRRARARAGADRPTASTAPTRSWTSVSPAAPGCVP